MGRALRRLCRVTTAVALLALTLGSAEASAAEPAAKAKKKVIKLEGFKVEGRLQKPQAFYILQRSSLNFEGLELKQSFLPQIVQSIEKPPF